MRWAFFISFTCLFHFFSGAKPPPIYQLYIPLKNIFYNFIYFSVYVRFAGHLLPTISTTEPTVATAVGPSSEDQVCIIFCHICHLCNLYSYVSLKYFSCILSSSFLKCAFFSDASFYSSLFLLSVCLSVCYLFFRRSGLFISPPLSLGITFYL